MILKKGRMAIPDLDGPDNANDTFNSSVLETISAGLVNVNVFFNLK